MTATSTLSARFDVHSKSAEAQQRLTTVASVALAPIGAVMAPMPLALEVPAFTDHAVWDGHQTWMPDSALRAQEVSDLLSGVMSAPQARAFVEATGVRWLIADCPSNGVQMFACLGPDGTCIHRFGCVDIALLTGRHATQPGWLNRTGAAVPLLPSPL